MLERSGLKEIRLHFSNLQYVRIPQKFIGEYVIENRRGMEDGINEKVFAGVAIDRNYSDFAYSYIDDKPTEISAVTVLRDFSVNMAEVIYYDGTIDQYNVNWYHQVLASGVDGNKQVSSAVQNNNDEFKENVHGDMFVDLGERKNYYFPDEWINADDYTIDNEKYWE